MADNTKKTDTDALGVVFTHPSPKRQDDAAITKLYDQPLTAISNPKTEAADTRVFNVERSLSGSHVEEGMIVSDRRKDRPSFFQNVIAAFKERRTQIEESLAHNHIIEKEDETVHEVTALKKETAVPNVVPSALHARVEETKSIAAQPLTPPPTPVPSVRTMPKAATPIAASTAAQTAAAPVTKKESLAATLPKIRTFKGDSALLNPHVAKAAAMHVPEPALPVPEKKVPAEKPVAPQKPVHIAAPDMRDAMIAPEVHTVLPADAFALASEKKSTSPITETKTPEPIVAARADIAPTVDEPAHWTYTKEVVDAVLDTEPKALEHIPLSEIKKSDLAPVAEPHFVDEPAYEPQEAEHDRVLRINETLARMRAEKAALPDSSDTVRTEETDSDRNEAMPTIESRDELRAYVKPGAEQPSLVPPVPEKFSKYAQNEPFHAVSTDSHNAPPVEITKPPLPPVVPQTVQHQVSVPRAQSSLGFALRILAVLVLVIGIAGVGTYFFMFMRTDAGTPDTTYTSTDDLPATVPQTGTSIPAPTTQTELVLGMDAQAFLADVATRVTDAPAGVTEFIVYADATLRVATTQELFAALGTSLTPRTIRALEPVFSVGSVTTDVNQPFIIIRSNNFDALFAGMLAWEPTMHRELAPLFGNAPTSDAVFTDAVRNNKSIRVLRDADGTEVMLYSFIDNRTVIITQSAEALAKLITQY